MRRGEIVDVHIVANARAVGRRIIVAEDRDPRSLSKGHLQHDPKQIRLWVVILAQISNG